MALTSGWSSGSSFGYAIKALKGRWEGAQTERYMSTPFKDSTRKASRGKAFSIEKWALLDL